MYQQLVTSILSNVNCHQCCQKKGDEKKKKKGKQEYYTIQITNHMFNQSLIYLHFSFSVSKQLIISSTDVQLNITNSDNSVKMIRSKEKQKKFVIFEQT